MSDSCSYHCYAYSYLNFTITFKKIVVNQGRKLRNPRSYICINILSLQLDIDFTRYGGQPFLNGRPFKNHHVFISTRNALPASVYKHPGVYKRSASFTRILPCKAKRQYQLTCLVSRYSLLA